MQDKKELVIDKMAKEIKELKQQLRKAEKEKQSALALLDLKKKVDQLCLDMNPDEEK